MSSSGFIDSASTYEILGLLSRVEAKDAGPLTWRTAIEVTCAILCAPHLRISPAPETTGAASGTYGRLMYGLSTQIEIYHLDPGVDAVAVARARRWLQRNTTRVADVLRSQLADQEYVRWQDQVIKDVWLENTSRLGGLFNASLVRELSRVLHILHPGAYIPEGELRRLLRKSQDIRVVTSYVNGGFDSDYRLIRDAYFASLLMRGIYHRYVAEAGSQQLLQHPTRNGLVTRSRPSSSLTFLVSGTLYKLAVLVLASAFAESKIDARIDLFVENVKAMRGLVAAGRADLARKSNQLAEEEAVITAAKRARIRVHPKQTERVLEHLLALITGILGSFVLEPWIGLAVGLAQSEISRRKALGRRISTAIAGTEKHLIELTTAEPGMLSRSWFNASND